MPSRLRNVRWDDLQEQIAFRVPPHVAWPGVVRCANSWLYSTFICWTRSMSRTPTGERSAFRWVLRRRAAARLRFVCERDDGAITSVTISYRILSDHITCLLDISGYVQQIPLYALCKSAIFPLPAKLMLRQTHPTALPSCCSAMLNQCQIFVTPRNAILAHKISPYTAIYFLSGQISLATS